MLHIITQQLQRAYENLKVSIHGLPSNIQEAVHQATRNIRKLHTSFSSAKSFHDLSSTTLAESRDYVVEAQRSLNDLLQYVTQNIPLNWLVGPFRARVKEDSRKEKKDATEIKRPALEKAATSEEVAKMPEEPKGAKTILEEVCEVLEKIEEKLEKDMEVEMEVALAAKELVTNAPKEDL